MEKRVAAVARELRTASTTVADLAHWHLLVLVAWRAARCAAWHLSLPAGRTSAPVLRQMATALHEGLMLGADLPHARTGLARATLRARCLCRMTSISGQLVGC